MSAEHPAATDAKIATLEIYLRSGQLIDVPVSDWTLKYEKDTGRITEFSWTHPDRETRIAQLDLREVVAVVRRPA